jgi:uncharacterized protein (DUF1330 family)
VAAYLIAITRHVNDRKKLEEYWSNAGPAFEGIAVKRLAVYAPFKRLEGDTPIEGIALMEFPDMDSAARWYASDAYQTVKRYRDGAVDIDLILVDGGVAPVEQRMPQTKR